jgi:metallo-beta-lactamase class B
MHVRDGGRSFAVVIVGSPNVNPGYRLVNNPSYPTIVADYERTFRVLQSLPHDIFLGAHGSYFDLERKYALLQEGASTPFVDPQGYQRYVADREAAFRKALEEQRGPR